MTTVADYLLIRLRQLGVGHIFGVPGDFVLGFLNRVLESPVEYVGTCNELNAAYAADGYARIRGIGALVTTYGVGELSALNGVAGAFAERVPVVVITGAPASGHFQTRALLHHTLGDYEIPLRMYEHITAASTLLSSGETAPDEIDRVLSACLTQRQPVYICLPADVVGMACRPPEGEVQAAVDVSDPAALAEALLEAVAMIEAARAPVIIADVELVRFGLQAELGQLLTGTGFPFVTPMLGKALSSEHGEQFIGLYQGDRSRPYVRERVESADCILQLGALLTDFNTGGFTASLDESKTITANIRSVQLKHHVYEGVALGEFMLGLARALRRRDPATLGIRTAVDEGVHRPGAAFTPVPRAPLTVGRFFDRISHHLKPNTIVIAETGVSLFGAAETLMPQGATFIGQTFYGSIGYTVGATLGVCMAAPGRPVVLFIGDGSFQVTGQDLSTMIRYKLRPLIFLINNDGYTIERVITDRSYNDIQPWRYHELVSVFGGGPPAPGRAVSQDVHTEGGLEQALELATAATGLVFVEIHTGRLDCPESLRSAGRSMAQGNQLAEG